MHQDYPYVDPSTGDYHEQIGAEGYSHFANDDVHVNGYDEAAGIFGSIGKFIGGAVSSVANVVQKGVGAITNNPLWDIARTGVSFIPGVGTAVSAGMAGASAIGRGDSLKDIGLAAAKGAIPGGPAAQAAFDVALGLAKGKNVTETILQAARSQVPGGDLGKAAFDAANAIARGKAFDAIALAEIRSKVPGGAVGKAAFDGAIANFKAKKGGGSADGSRPFAHLNLVGNRVASAMNARPELMRAPASSVARDLNVSVENVQKAFAAFMSKWGDARRAWTDVGASDSLESCCEREAIPMGAGDFDDAGYLQNTGDDDTGAPYWTTGKGNYPRLAMSKPYAQALYRHGHNGVRQGMLAHGILARLHHQTGELDGAGGWMIRSGDTPSAIAQKMTGSAARWREMLAVNPKLKVVTVNGVMQVQPFIPGQRITLPTSWLGTAAPAPQVPPAGAPPLTGAQPTIQQGSTGQTVKQWQQLLLNLGSVLVGSADGIFGPQTAAATKAYQAARGLQPDGVVGPLTWGKAMAEAAARAGGPPPIVVSVPPIVVRPPVPGLPPVSLPPVSLPPAPPPPSMPPIVVSTPPVVVGPAVPSSAPQVAIGAIEAALAYFFQQHPDAQFITVPSYGLMPEDHSGTWDDRDKTAMLGFQKWCNDNPGKVGFPLPISGQPDELSVKALQAITAADLSRQTGQKIPPPPPIVTPPAGKPPVTTAGSSDDSGLLLLGLAGAAVVLMSGGKGRRAA